MSEKYTFNKFRNGSNLKFIDISSEAWREYLYPDGTTVRVQGPVALNVSKSGGHRIFDEAGVSNYIPNGWKHLRWMVKDNQPHFVA